MVVHYEPGSGSTGTSSPFKGEFTFPLSLHISLKGVKASNQWYDAISRVLGPKCVGVFLTSPNSFSFTALLS